MLIDDDEKRENASVENSLMKKVKVKNEFEEEREKNLKKKIFKKTYAQRIKERMGEYYEEKPFKIHVKRKKDEILEMVKF